MQVNRGVCRKLYERTVRLALDSGAGVVIDAYSGCGLLTAMLARQVGRAYGIEVVPEASACADSLIEPNRLEGKLFNICGKVEEELPALLQRVDAQDAFLVVDPPRKGVDRATLGAILASGIPQVAMISCNPSTLARDLGILTGALVETADGLKKNRAYVPGEMPGRYAIRSVLPLDMFPQTKWVETLVLLERK